MFNLLKMKNSNFYKLKNTFKIKEKKQVYKNF